MAAGNWIPVPDESWRNETARYRSRLDHAVAVSESTVTAISTYYPGVFFPQSEPPPQVIITSRLSIYASNLFSLATPVRNLIRDLWWSGQFTVVPLNTRFVMESWGAIHFARGTLERLVRSGDIAREQERTNRLTFGARSPVELPWGGKTELQSFNVVEFIRGLRDIRADAEDMYGFLSEASHPNLFQNSYFQMASSPVSNWSNESFKRIGHSLLERVLEAFEASTRGMESDLEFILKEGTRYVEESLR